MKKGMHFFRPCLDLHEGKVKQIVGKSLGKREGIRENFVSDLSSEAIAQVYRRDGLQGGHMILLGGKEGRQANEQAALKALKAYPNGLQVGGGVTRDNALYWLKQGASGVIVTSFILSEEGININRLKQLKKIIGRKQLILDLSVKKKAKGTYVIATKQWQKQTNLVLNQERLETLSEYCEEFLIHSIDAEGEKKGADKELIRLLVKLSPIKTVYAGGISSYQEIEWIEHLSKQHQNKLFYSVGSALDLFGGEGLSYQKLSSR